MNYGLEVFPTFNYNDLRINFYIFELPTNVTIISRQEIVMDHFLMTSVLVVEIKFVT
jgi:hypothetical protein